jgi:hypothetical protein
LDGSKFGSIFEKMSLHIHRFVDSVKAHEARGQKDFSMPMRDAKDLTRRHNQIVDYIGTNA